MGGRAKVPVRKGRQEEVLFEEQKKIRENKRYEEASEKTSKYG